MFIDFDKNIFLDDKSELSKKYKVIGKGTEGVMFEVTDSVVAKKFYSPRSIYVKEVQDVISSCNPSQILVPFDYLIEDNLIYTAFLERFYGKSVHNDISEINFDVLIPCTKKLIEDIYKISEYNVLLQDVTRTSIMYNDKNMILVDTTKYSIATTSKKYNSEDIIFQSNLSELFKDLINNLFFNNDFLHTNIILNNQILNDLKYDYENYGFFFEELQKSMEEKLECKVLSIKDGVYKINNMYKR